MESGDFEEHARRSRRRPPAQAGEEVAQAGQTSRPGVLEATLGAADRETHLALAGLHAEFVEQAREERVGALVVHDESAVDSQRRAAPVVDVVGVRVSAEPVGGFEHRHPVSSSGQDVCRRQPGDPAPDDGDVTPTSECSCCSSFALMSVPIVMSPARLGSPLVSERSVLVDVGRRQAIDVGSTATALDAPRPQLGTSSWGVAVAGLRQAVDRTGTSVQPESSGREPRSPVVGGEPDHRVAALLDVAQQRTHHLAECGQGGGHTRRVRPARVHRVEDHVTGVDGAGPELVEGDLRPLGRGHTARCHGMSRRAFRGRRP